MAVTLFRYQVLQAKTSHNDLKDMEHVITSNDVSISQYLVMALCKRIKMTSEYIDNVQKVIAGMMYMNYSFGVRLRMACHFYR